MIKKYKNSMIEKIFFKKMALTFIKFLQKEKCLDAYYEIIQTERSKKTRRGWGHPVEYQTFLQKYYNRPDMWLRSAFEWSTTVQGHSYWAIIQIKWLEEMRKIKKNIPYFNSYC